MSDKFSTGRKPTLFQQTKATDPSTPRQPDVQAGTWGAILALGIILALVVGACASKGSNGSKAPQPTPSQDVKPLPEARLVSTTQSKQAPREGLAYQTAIPRLTVKGYFEPKVVPYPEGKPVYVRGYYRKNGTYVQPHFRSLPRR
jgi:hypothetical protein